MRYESGGSLATLIHGSDDSFDTTLVRPTADTAYASKTHTPLQSKGAAATVKPTPTPPQPPVLPMVEKLRLLKEVAYGLCQLHGNGIVHGDIKVWRIHLYIPQDATIFIILLFNTCTLPCILSMCIYIA